MTSLTLCLAAGLAFAVAYGAGMQPTCDCGESLSSLMDQLSAMVDEDERSRDVLEELKGQIVKITQDGEKSIVGPTGLTNKDLRKLEKKFRKGLKQAVRYLIKEFPDYPTFPSDAKCVLAIMLMEVGVEMFNSSSSFKEAVEMKDWSAAGRWMENSKWYNDNVNKGRLDKMITTMENAKHEPEDMETTTVMPTPTPLPPIDVVVSANCPCKEEIEALQLKLMGLRQNIQKTWDCVTDLKEVIQILDDKDDWVLGKWRGLNKFDLTKLRETFKGEVGIANTHLNHWLGDTEDIPGSAMRALLMATHEVGLEEMKRLEKFKVHLQKAAWWSAARHLENVDWFAQHPNKNRIGALKDVLIALAKCDMPNEEEIEEVKRNLINRWGKAYHTYLGKNETLMFGVNRKVRPTNELYSLPIGTPVREKIVEKTFTKQVNKAIKNSKRWDTDFICYPVPVQAIVIEMIYDCSDDSSRKSPKRGMWKLERLREFIHDNDWFRAAEEIELSECLFAPELATRMRDFTGAY